jgi:hypothetical protein
MLLLRFNSRSVPATPGWSAVPRCGVHHISNLAHAGTTASELMALNEELTRSDVAEKEVRLASLREKEVRLIQESHDIESRLFVKGRLKEAESQRAQTADLKQKQERLRIEIHDLS